MNIASHIKALRMQKRISTQELSSRLKWPNSKITKLENGNQKISTDDLQQIADALQVNLVSLIVGGCRKDQLENYPQNLGMLIEDVSKNYLKEATKDLTINKTAPIITREIPNYIQRIGCINPREYLVKGGLGGKPNIAKVPWIAVLRRSITETPQRGIYVVYLFSADMEKVYLSLNQGVTSLNNSYGEKEACILLKKISKKIRGMIATIPEGMDLEEIDLKYNKKLAKGYMAGHILGVEYDVNNLPEEDQLIRDLDQIMYMYDRVIDLIGNRTVEEFYECLLLNEEESIEAKEKFEEVLKEEARMMETSKAESYKGVPQKKLEPLVDKRGRRKYPRDERVKARALVMANFTCENDPTHESFISKKTNRPYMEGHHLIPLEYFEDFQYSLDVEENICCLCSKSHDCIHYGTDEQKILILKRLYKKRKEHLNRAGIEIDFDTLKKYYNIKEL